MTHDTPTPLQIMADAIKGESEDIYGGTLTADSAKHIARTALLALADADLGAFDGAVTGPSATRTDASDRAGIFRAMLRAIADEDKTNE